MVKRIWRNCSVLKNVSLIKEDLGINLTWNKNIIRITFVKATSFNDHKVVCRYCNRIGHLSYACPIKKNAYFGIKIVCASKGTIANT